jgi:serine/threonine protein kinase
VQALASCHAEGVFHGDLKPHNVKAQHWIDDGGIENVKATLLDFGAGCLIKGMPFLADDESQSSVLLLVVFLRCIVVCLSCDKLRRCEAADLMLPE